MQDCNTIQYCTIPLDKSMLACIMHALVVNDRGAGRISANPHIFITTRAVVAASGWQHAPSPCLHVGRNYWLPTCGRGSVYAASHDRQWYTVRCEILMDCLHFIYCVIYHCRRDKSEFSTVLFSNLILKDIAPQTCASAAQKSRKPTKERKKHRVFTI